jgi:hypothetical protein
MSDAREVAERAGWDKATAVVRAALDEARASPRPAPPKLPKGYHERQVRGSALFTVSRVSRIVALGAVLRELEAHR